MQKKCGHYRDKVPAGTVAGSSFFLNKNARITSRPEQKMIKLKLIYFA